MTIEAMRSDMVAAMKAKDKVRKEAISALISAAKKAAIDVPNKQLKKYKSLLKKAKTASSVKVK